MTTEWNYPVETLPKWDIHKREFGGDDRLFESDYAKYACLLYSIVEWRMGWYSGYLAILRDKRNPKLIINPTNTMWYPWVQFSLNEDILFLCSYNGGEYPIIILNLEKKCFSALRVVNGFHYSIKEIDSTHFKLIADVGEMNSSRKIEWVDGMVFNLKRQRWFPINKLDHLSEILPKLKMITAIIK